MVIFIIDPNTKIRKVEAVNRKYIVDENQNTVAVQIDILEFEKMEQVIEDYALGKFIEENDSHDRLNISDAKVFYKTLAKEK